MSGSSSGTGGEDRRTPTDQAADRAYRRLVRGAQRDARVPAVQAALYRADRPLWTFEVGDAGDGVTLGPDTQFRIGSITKTFTAVLVMQCRDEGLLELDDPISAHLDVPAHRDLTIRRLLSHGSGLQREPHGDLWEHTDALPTDVLADLAHAEAVLPQGRRFHYSNLAVGLLGRMVADKRGGSWFDVLAEKVLRPLELSLSYHAGPDAATGYLVDAYSDHARPEPRTDMGAIAPAAQLWGTAGDLARWAAFLADPAEMDPKGAVLSADTLHEMRHPITLIDEVDWQLGFGLGPMIFVRPGRTTDIGHEGAMPGFLAFALGRRGPGAPPALAAAALFSSGTAASGFDLVPNLMDAAIEHDPADVEPWRIGAAPPADLRDMLGHWWGEGFEFTFSWHDGHLQGRRAAAPPELPPAVFEPAGQDVYRVASGRETGELLRLTRDDAGRVVLLHWATYRFTRRQETFDQVSPSEPGANRS